MRSSSRNGMTWIVVLPGTAPQARLGLLRRR
jgi:hypothetical protein